MTNLHSYLFGGSGHRRALLPLFVAVVAGARVLTGCGSPQPDRAADAQDAEAAPAEASAPAPDAAPAADTAAETDTAEAPGTLGSTSLVDVAGIEALLEAGQGQVTVVNLWATWCPPCIDEMPYFIELHQKHGGDGVKLVSLSLDDPDTLDSKVKAFQEKEQLPFDVYVLDESVDLQALDEPLGTTVEGVLPTTIVYGPDGQVDELFETPVTLEQLEAAVAAAA